MAAAFMFFTQTLKSTTRFQILAYPSIVLLETSTVRYEGEICPELMYAELR